MCGCFIPLYQRVYNRDQSDVVHVTFLQADFAHEEEMVSP